MLLEIFTKVDVLLLGSLHDIASIVSGEALSSQFQNIEEKSGFERRDFNESRRYPWSLSKAVMRTTNLHRLLGTTYVGVDRLICGPI